MTGFRSISGLRGAGSSKSMRSVSPPSSVMTHLFISGRGGNDVCLLGGSKLLMGCGCNGASVVEPGKFDVSLKRASIGLRLCLVPISVKSFLKFESLIRIISTTKKLAADGY